MSQTAPQPPLGCPHAELVAFIRSLKPGDRVIELGYSGMKGQTGTVELREGNVLIRWDTKFEEGTGMVTSFTGGARLLDTSI